MAGAYASRLASRADVKCSKTPGAFSMLSAEVALMDTCCCGGRAAAAVSEFAGLCVVAGCTVGGCLRSTSGSSFSSIVTAQLSSLLMSLSIALGVPRSTVNRQLGGILADHAGLIV